jgi:hypothetical protein
MSRRKSLSILGAMATAVLAVGTTAPAGDPAGARVLTVRAALLYRSRGDTLVADGRLPALSELTLDGGRTTLVDGAGVSYRPVRWARDGAAWVRQADVAAIPQPGPRPGGLPPLIARQPVAIQRSWLSIEAAIRENAQLRPPLPQPYLARAELWAMVSNYDAAIDDLLTAAQLARRRGATTADQVELLKRLEVLLARHAATPRPLYRGDARSHFQAGYDAYHEGWLSEALTQFATAVQYDPEDMVLWYYKALTNKRMLNEPEAERDIAMAVYLERRNHATLGDPHWTRLFTRVQGPLRNWMEAYRSGLTPGV